MAQSAPSLEPTSTTLQPASASLETPTPSLQQDSRAQSSTQPDSGLPDHGFYTYIGVGAGHDPFARSSGEFDVSGGYDFGRTLEIETGVPFFFLSTTTQTTAKGVTDFSNRYSAFGDVFLRAKVTPAIDGFDFTSTATITAPTGAKNVSAGQATWDWNNRGEFDLWRLRPFGEFVLGNVPPVTPRLLGPFSISGFATQLRLGNSFTLMKTVSFDASFYDSIPMGNSSVITQSTSLISSPAPGSNLLSDRGLTGTLSPAIVKRFEFDITYNRSLAYSLNAISVMVRYRLGHVRRIYE